MGTAKPPARDDLKYEVWDAKNSMVMSWLLHSMQLEIGKTYLLLSTAKDIWESVLKTYSKVGVPSQIFELKQQIVNTEQGSSTVTRVLRYSQRIFVETRFIPKPGDGDSH